MKRDQCFSLINIDQTLYAAKTHVGAQLGCGNLGQWYFSEVAGILMDLLSMPKVKLPDDPLEGQVFSSPTTSGFFSLPREIQQQIIEELDDFNDTFCFIATSRYMWTIGIRTLRRLYVRWALHELGSWVGHRLIIMGNSTKETPARAFTDLELKTMENSRPDLALFQRLVLMESKIVVKRGYSRSSELYFRLSERHRCRISPWMGECVDWMVVEPSLEFPLNAFLHNLTTKEYVREDALTLPPEYRVGTRYDPLTLGHALMSRIVWSADPSVGIPLSPQFSAKFVRGVWAGCQFDIVGVGEWKELDGWKDVSVEVKEGMVYLAIQGESLYIPDTDSQE